MDLIEKFEKKFSIINEEAIFFKDLFVNMMKIDENIDLFSYDVKKYRLRDHRPSPFSGWFVDRIASVKNGHVIDLDLTRMGLSHNDIPESITLLTKLKHLRLNANNLKNLPKSISLLKSLRSLKLYKNQFTKFPKSILSLENLRYLSLENNRLKKLPHSISTLRCLIRLNLLDNNIKKIPNSLFELSERNLAKEYILNGVIPEEASVLGLLELLSGIKLQKIEMNKQASDYNDINHWMYNYKLNQSGNVIEIWLYSMEPFLGIFPVQLCQLKYLEELHLEKNSIKFIPKQIGKLGAIKVLNLMLNRIVRIPKSIKNLKNLKVLGIFGNNDIKKIPKSIKEYLEKNRIKKYL